MSASNYPTSLDTTSDLPDNITDNTALNSPDHASLHNTISDAVIALETKLGTNSEQGSATLTSGTVNISDAAITATSIILLSYTSTSSNIGTLYIYSQTTGSFIVKSTNSSDANSFNWKVFN